MFEKTDHVVVPKNEEKSMFGVVSGPKVLNMEFFAEGVQYVVREGVVTPPITADLIPINLWGLGFTVEKG